MTITRRALLAGVAALAALRILPAHAQDASAATAFIQAFGTKLVGIVNSDAPLADKQREIRPLIDQSVDVDGIARFCLGRYADQASPQQLAEYTQLFHGVLVNNIVGKLGEYRGVSFRMTDSVMRGDEAYVGTIVNRPNNAPNNVRWVVSDERGAPKIVDVVAEGTSLRLTQRSDYASYLARNGYNLDALITAMRRQVEAGG